MCVNTLPVFVKLLPDSRLWEGYGLYLAIPAVEGRGEERGGGERKEGVRRKGKKRGGGGSSTCKYVERGDVTVWICNGGTHWVMVWTSRMYAMQAAFSPSIWTFGVTIDCWIETPGVAGTGGRG